MPYILVKLKKRAISRTIEYQQDNFNGKWESSGAIEHWLECHGQLNWINPKTLSTKQQYRKRKIKEPLEIKKAKINIRRKILNRDEENLVKTNTCTRHFAKLIEKETNKQRLDIKLKKVLIAPCVSITFENGFN